MRAARAGWALLGLSAAFVAAAAFLVRGAPTNIPGLEVATAEDVVDAFLHLAYAVLGALILMRQPRNLFGWAFLLIALCFEASLFAGAYSTYGTFTHPGSLPAPQLLSLMSDVLFVPCLVLVVTFVPLLFPTGFPPTRRWWVVGAAAGAAIVLATMAMVIRPGPVDEDVPAAGANPLGIPGAGATADTIELAALLLFFSAALGSLASIIVRTRRSRGEERRQVTIFLSAVALVFAVIFVPDEPLGLGGEAAQIALAVVGILALPSAVAIALLRPAMTRVPRQHSRLMSSCFVDHAARAGNPRSSMTQPLETHPSVAVYTPARLALYDLVILGISCSLVWRCPRRHFLDLYDRQVGTPHLDIGVGTGYFLDRCRFPTDRPQITLLDPSDACLSKAARRLERYSPRVVKASALEPLDLGSARFVSVALNGVLHCLPATPETKASVFRNLRPFLEDGAVVFGSTILGSGVDHGRLARQALARYNREGFFTNLADDLGGLERVLAHNFADHHIEVRGSFALFAAHSSST